MNSEGLQQPNSDAKKKVLATVCATTGVLVLCIVPFLAPAFRRLCVPWMGTPLYIVRNALDKVPARSNLVLNASQPRRLVDLGSGDGRIVIEAALRGYQSVGIELNPLLVAYSYYKSWRMGVLGSVSFQMVDFFKFELKSFDVITCFGSNGIMETLSAKIQSEAPQESSVVCYRFPLLNKKPFIQDGELYIYKKSDL